MAAAAKEQPAKYKYAEWVPGQPWPSDVPRRVRNKTTNTNGFYKDQLVPPGTTCTLEKPSDFSEQWMEAEDTDHGPLAKKPPTPREVAQGAKPRTSADLTRPNMTPALHPDSPGTAPNQSARPGDKPADKPKGDHVL